MYFQGKNKLIWFYTGSYYYPWTCHHLLFKALLFFFHATANGSIDWLPIWEVYDKEKEILSWNWVRLDYQVNQKTWSRFRAWKLDQNWRLLRKKGNFREKLSLLSPQIIWFQLTLLYIWFWSSICATNNQEVV